MKVVAATFAEFGHQCIGDLNPLGVVFAEVKSFAIHCGNHGIEVGFNYRDLCELAFLRLCEVLLKHDGLGVDVNPRVV